MVLYAGILTQKLTFGNNRIIIGVLKFFTTQRGVKMDFFKMKTFLRAVELGSLSKAAQELGYAPSALSHMLRSLEQELGLTLLKRSPAGITLTENGKALQSLFQAAVEAENAIYATAQKLAAQVGVVHIGTYASISKFVLPKIVKEFNRMYPQVKISVTVANRFSPETAGKLDMVFAENDTVSGQCWTPLFEDEYVAVVKEDWLSGKTQAALETLRTLPFILPNDTVVKALCRDRLSNVIEVSSDDDTSLISMVREGLGFTVLPKLSACAESGVRTVRLDPPVKRILGLSYSKANLSPAAARLIAHIKQHFSGQKD